MQKMLLGSMFGLIVALSCAAAQGDHVDAAGDPLPKGAVARLGTLRFRHWPLTEWVSLSHDSKIVAFGGRESGFWFADRATGKVLVKIAPLGPQYTELNPAWSSRKNILVAGCRSHPTIVADDKELSAVVIWDTTTGKELRRVDVPRYCAEAIALSPDGKTVASGGVSRVVRLLDVASGKVKEITPPVEGAGGFRFSPDGQWLAIADRNSISLWDLKQGKEKLRLQSGKSFFGLTYGRLAFSPDSQFLVGGGVFGVVSIWKVATGEWLGDLPDSGHSVHSLAVSADSKQVALGRGRLHQLTVYDLATRKEAGKLDVGVGCLAYSADGKFLASAYTGVVSIRDSKSLKEVAGPVGHRGPISLIRFLDDDHILTVSPYDKTCRTWEAASGREKAQFSLGTKPGPGVVVSADGKLLAINQWINGPNTGTKKILVFDVATGKARHTFEASNNDAPLAFSSDNTLLYSATGSNDVVIWDLAKDKELRRLKVATPLSHRYGAFRAALTPDDRALALNLQTTSSPSPGTLTQTEYVALIDLKTGKEQWSQKVEIPPGILLWSSDGKYLFEDQAGVVFVRERESGKVIRTLTGRNPDERYPWPNTSALAASNNGKTLLGTNGRNRVHLWDIASGQELQRLSTHDGQIVALAVSTNGRLFATAGDDMTVLVWKSR